jgi:hypothetical protein
MKYSILLFVLISFYACNNSAKQLELGQSQASDFNGPKQLAEINSSISKKTADVTEGDGYSFWYENGKLIKLYIEGGYGGNFSTKENYFFDENGKVFAYNKDEVNGISGFTYRLQIYFNGPDIVDESYWFNEVERNRKNMDVDLSKVGYSINDIINDKETKKPRGLLTISDLSKEYSIDFSVEQTNKKNRIQEGSDSLKPFADVQLTLMDGSLKKAKLYLGEPDKYVHPFGHISKGYAVYFNKVSNNGKPQHLVLFLRMKGNFWGDDAKIEEIYAIGDNSKACFGIHCLYVENKQIHIN